MCSKKRVSKDLSHLASLLDLHVCRQFLLVLSDSRLPQETIRLREDAKLLEGGAVEAIDSSKERQICVVHTSGHIFLRWQETDPMMSEESQSHQKKCLPVDSVLRMRVHQGMRVSVALQYVVCNYVQYYVIIYILLCTKYFYRMDCTAHDCGTTKA